MRQIPLLLGALILGACDSPTDTGPVATTVMLSSATLSFSSVGETQQLTATVGDQNGATMSGASVAWASSATTVASVSSTGLVTAEADGTATIMATSGSATEAASVTVQQVAASITLSRTRLSLSSVGERRQLNATVRDQNGVTISGASLTWSSDDPGVVRVSSSAWVTAVSVGSATISVEVAGGNQRVTQSISVTVEPPVLEPSDLCTQNVGTATATFEDWLLEKAIRSALSIGFQDALTCNLLSSMTELNATNQRSPHSGIGSLVGIQNLTGLANLSLSWNQSISDINALSELTSLTSLSLQGNNIRDISALSGLTSLTNLSLHENEIITDISVLTATAPCLRAAVESSRRASVTSRSEDPCRSRAAARCSPDRGRVD